jgi:hypothetical protein
MFGSRGFSDEISTWRSSPARVVALALVLVAGLQHPGRAERSVMSASSPLQVTLVGDATIRQDDPDTATVREDETNFGGSGILEVDSSPVEDFLIKFRVENSGNSITKAELLLHTTDSLSASSDQGGVVFPASNLGSDGAPWSEDTVTWNTSPARTSTWPVATLPAVARDASYGVDVTSFVLGDGTYSFRVRPASSDGAEYYSEEGSPSFKPVLRVTTSTQQVVMAAGDIACDPADPFFNNGEGRFDTVKACRQKYTGALLAGGRRVLPLGDTQYEDGAPEDFLDSYDLSWGKHKTKTHPSVGNHEYLVPGFREKIGAEKFDKAEGYFDYFGEAAGDPTEGYYRVDLGGGWVGLALNTNCGNTEVIKDKARPDQPHVVSCGVGSPQWNWLKAQLDDLRARSIGCALTWAHHPRWTSTRAFDEDVRPLYQLMYDYGVELALAGHTHNYERWAPQRPDGTRDTTKADGNPYGVTQFVAGGGGKNLEGFPTTGIDRDSLVRRARFGVLKLTLRNHATEWDYRWQFIEPGTVLGAGTISDSGTGNCR